MRESAGLNVFLEGRSPWSFDLYDGATTTTYNNIAVNNYALTITPDQTATYRVTTVTDVNGVVNSGEGNPKVVVNEKTYVEIINLASGYSVEADPVELEANISGGTFSGPGVITATGYFDPGIADTIDSPHTIYYTFTNPNGCTSVASALVFVLGARGGHLYPL